MAPAKGRAYSTRSSATRRDEETNLGEPAAADNAEVQNGISRQEFQNLALQVSNLGETLSSLAALPELVKNLSGLAAGIPEATMVPPPVQEPRTQPSRAVHADEHHAESAISVPSMNTEDLQKKMEEMERKMKSLVGQLPNTASARRLKTPFSDAILQATHVGRLDFSNLKTFDGTSDPADHLERFSTLLSFQCASDEVKCRAFPTSLEGGAAAWFKTLAPGTISNFQELGDKFLEHFTGYAKPVKTSSYLLTIRQQPV